MITRPEDPNDPMAIQLSQLGAEIIVQPAICIGPPPDWQPVDAALARLDQFDWLVFSSVNGVRSLLDRMREKGISPIFRAKLAAIGPGTADELARWQLHADIVPKQFRAEALADALVQQATGQRFLLIRASRGREVLAQRLTAAGATVEQAVLYLNTDVERPNATVKALLHAHQIDWITVTSSSIARSLVKLFGKDLHRAKLASISPLTSSVLTELGHEPAAEATEYSVPGLVAAIVNGS
jgi:uroporphyrinogen III methyltransferase / synthase